MKKGKKKKKKLSNQMIQILTHYQNYLIFQFGYNMQRFILEFVSLCEANE